MTTFIGHPNGNWTLDGPVTEFRSSDEVTRAFCNKCGSPLFYKSSMIPDETHFYAALLEDPQNAKPTVHWHFDEALPWLHVQDDLVKKGV